MATSIEDPLPDSLLGREASATASPALNKRKIRQIQLRQAARRRRAQAINVELNVGQRALFWMMVALIHAFSLIPDSILYRLGYVGGLIGYRVDRRHVQIGLRNLAIAFPEKSEAESRRILRDSYINLGRSAAEYIRLGGFFYRSLMTRVSYNRYGYWHEILNRKGVTGAIVLTAHFGNFELLPAAHAMHGEQITLVHHTQRFLSADSMMTYIRKRAGITILRKHAAARAVLKALRSGEVIGIPFDQNAKRSDAVFVPFFGEPAATSSGLARLVAISRVPVIPVFLVRQPDGRSHRVEIMEELTLQFTDDHEADVEENTRRFTRTIEDVVRRYPEQFLWTHRRYRTRPRGMPPVYDS